MVVCGEVQPDDSLSLQRPLQLRVIARVLMTDQGSRVFVNDADTGAAVGRIYFKRETFNHVLLAHTVGTDGGCAGAPSESMEAR